jgi:hypothetical protein
MPRVRPKKEAPVGTNKELPAEPIFTPKAIPGYVDIPADPAQLAQDIYHHGKARTYKPRTPKPLAPPPPNPTVLEFQRQLPPLLERQEIIQGHIRSSQKAIQQLQATLAEDQQALQDTDAAIQRRLTMIAQLTGAPAPSYAPHPSYAQYPVQPIDRYAPLPAAQINYDDINLHGNPNIPSNITSIPAPTQRYTSEYVPKGERNPRTESAVAVRNDPETQREAQQVAYEVKQAMLAAGVVI